MVQARSVRWLSMLIVVVAAACGDDGDHDNVLLGPGVDPGSGRIYPVRDVQFVTRDGVQVSAMLATPPVSHPAPGVVLLHDLDGDKKAWLTRSPLFVALLDRDYAVLSLDLRGYGDTPLPDGRKVAKLEDLDNSYLDVEAALDWLAGRTDVDTSRVALIGSGSGGNIVYVGMGILSGRVRTAVAVSPGLWARDSLRPVVVGAGADPFAPASILFVVGEDDVMPAGDSSGTVLRYADFAAALASNTAEPKSVVVIPGSKAHGLDLLRTQPAAMEAVLGWLEDHL